MTTSLALLDLAGPNPLMILTHPYRPWSGGTSAPTPVGRYCPDWAKTFAFNPPTDRKNFLEELLANPVNERTVTNVYSSHHGCTDFLVRNRASSATEGRNLDSSIPTKDMP